jgi:hypothetical protein
MGCAVRLEWHVRRFFCTNKECARRIFDLPSSQRSGSLRSTPRRLTELFTLIGFALAGEAGKQLVEAMGEHTSPDTLLRLIRKAPEATSSTPRVLGVDDFSFRRGRIFGTILVDLEKRVPIDLLPDREADTLEKWLQAHRGGEIVSRDRGGNYAQGARKGAPKACQVADRFHLLKNLGESLEDFFRDKKAALNEAVQDKAAAPLQEAAPPVPWHTGMRHPARGKKPGTASGACGALSPDP